MPMSNRTLYSQNLSITDRALAVELPQVTVKQLEQWLLLQTLKRLDGDRNQAAAELGLSLRAVRYKVKELIEIGYIVTPPLPPKYKREKENL